MATDTQAVAGNVKVSHTEELKLTQRFSALSANPNLVEYQGWAKPGTASSAAGWRIMRLTYSGNFVTTIEWADGDTNFDNVWDDRAALSYS